MLQQAAAVKHGERGLHMGAAPAWTYQELCRTAQLWVDGNGPALEFLGRRGLVVPEYPKAAQLPSPTASDWFSKLNCSYAKFKILLLKHNE